MNKKNEKTDKKIEVKEVGAMWAHSFQPIGRLLQKAMHYQLKRIKIVRKGRDKNLFWNLY